MKQTSWIINSFALLHAATAVTCRLVGWDDSLLLTLMTMLMTAWLCLARGYSLEISAVCVILVNVVGFILGTGLAHLVNFVAASDLITRPIASFLTTEILGWGILLLTKYFNDPNGTHGTAWNTTIKWLFIAFFAILIFRYGYLSLFSFLYDDSDAFANTFFSLIINAPVLLVLCCANILFIRIARQKKNHFGLKLTTFFVFALIISAIAALIQGYQLPFGHSEAVGLRALTGIYLIALILDLTIYSIVYIFDYASGVARERDKARMRTQEVMYQYDKLKQQISPHFFFNSLNILDCIVCEGKSDQASEYIHKLAGIYRYMLGRGEDQTVMLSDELRFVGMYTDLLRLRFGNGLQLCLNVSEDLGGKMVVPCSVQLLIENVCKHNVTSHESPMTVQVDASGDYLTVRNPLCPKLTPSGEGGHGLKYISTVYENLCGRPIIVTKTATEFIVSIPLI